MIEKYGSGIPNMFYSNALCGKSDSYLCFDMFQNNYFPSNLFMPTEYIANSRAS